MPYTADLLYNGACTSGTAGKLLRKLNAKNDTSAIAETECLLRSWRVVASVKGAEPPAAGVIAKDGKEFVCCIVNQPIEEVVFATADQLQSMN